MTELEKAQAERLRAALEKIVASYDPENRPRRSWWIDWPNGIRRPSIGPATMAWDTSLDVRNYIFKPQADITAYELATILPVVISGSLVAYDALPDKMKRHFAITGEKDK